MAQQFGHMGAVVAQRGQFGDVAKTSSTPASASTSRNSRMPGIVDQPTRANVAGAICCHDLAYSAGILRGVSDIRQAVLDRRFSDARLIRPRPCCRLC
jgi:hypothetical protein